MLVTRSGNSYNMSNSQNPNTNLPQLQAQITQLAAALEQINHRSWIQWMNAELEMKEQEFGDRGARFEGNGRDFPKGQGERDFNHHLLDELTKGMKVDVLDFFGNLDPNAFEDWLTANEDYFDWFSMFEYRRVRYVCMKLKGHAQVWWGSVEEQLHHTRCVPMSNWEEMKERLKEKYLPIDYEQMMFEEMLQLRQGTLTVDQYTDRFHELTVCSKVLENEQQTLACYHTGLRNDLRKEMLNARLLNVNEAYQLALQVEKQLGLSSGRQMASTDTKQECAPTQLFQKTPLPIDQNRNTVVGDQRGKAKLTGDGPQCYKFEGVEEEEDEESDGEDVEHLGATNLPSCVIHRVLTGTKKKVQVDSDWRRTKIFHTRMEHSGRALNVIIDNRSGMNVISSDAVERLGLIVEKHPTPYRDIHEEVKRRLSLSTAAYTTTANTKQNDRHFDVGDMVLICLRPERFPLGSFTKLHARRVVPFKVAKRLGPNAYVIELPNDYGISSVFNIEDLTKFHGSEEQKPAATNLPTQQDAIICVPKNTAPRDEIASILDHQFVTTRRGGYYKFLVQWKNRPSSDSI
ncbi:hypothetical protein Patl1_15534 [Pistacia atlantica]|uniref:Uncharacterized protein n=1 Tax=Pistacia atlantica TaxID=434234 RepID=A0ACC1B966_9ROSI|nr:hypothetical protein Patl1_15534 [Pistacia atlantica]